MRSGLLIRLLWVNALAAGAFLLAPGRVWAQWGGDCNERTAIVFVSDYSSDFNEYQWSASSGLNTIVETSYTSSGQEIDTTYDLTNGYTTGTITEPDGAQNTTSRQMNNDDWNYVTTQLQPGIYHASHTDIGTAAYQEWSNQCYEEQQPIDFP